MKSLQISDSKLVILFIIIIGMLFFTGLYLYKHQREKKKQEKFAEISAIASLKASQLANYRNERVGDAKVISGSEFFTAEIEDWIKNQNNQQLENRLVNYIQSILENYQYKGVLIVDTVGKIYLAVGYELPSIGEATYSFIRESMHNKSVTISTIYYCDLCSDKHLDIFAPLFVGEKLIGGMVFRLDPDEFLYPLIQSWPTPSETSESLLVTTDGDEVVFLNKLRHIENAALKLRFKIDSSNIHIPAVAVTYGIEGSMEGIDYRGVSVLADIRKIPGSPWWMIVKVDLKEVYALTRDNAFYLSSIFGVLILFFASSFLWLRNNQKKTMRLLESQSKYEMQMREIAERKRTEEALRLKNWVFDASLAANSVADFDGIIREVNDSFLRLLEFESKSDVVGMPIKNFIQHKEKTLEIMTALNKTGKWEGVFTAKKKNGSTFTAQSMATVLKDENQKVVGYQSAVVDITQRKQLEDEVKKHNLELDRRVKNRTLELEISAKELRDSQAALLNIVDDLNEKTQELANSKAQLEDSNRELESFSYSVSHDLRTPLRALDGFSRILLEDYSSVLDSEGKRYLNIIKDNATNMGELIDDLLKFSRLNKQEIQFSKINLYNQAKSVFQELTQQTNVTDIDFEIEELPYAYGDYAMLNQVWRNLIGNAIKYRSKKDKLVIKIGNKTDKMENIYFVKDNGVGFDMAYVDKLFGVFQRLHSSKEFEGTGVGLAIVQRIVHRMGGKVWAEAEVDKGATFYFSLPNRIN